MSKPVYGSATAEMSLSRRLVPQAVWLQPGVSCCHEGAVNRVLHPPPVALYCLNSSVCEGRPLSFHTDSLLRVPFALRWREVPPTATTVASAAGEVGAHTRRAADTEAGILGRIRAGRGVSNSRGCGASCSASGVGGADRAKDPVGQIPGTKHYGVSGRFSVGSSSSQT